MVMYIKTILLHILTVQERSMRMYTFNMYFLEIKTILLQYAHPYSAGRAYENVISQLGRDR